MGSEKYGGGLIMGQMRAVKLIMEPDKGASLGECIWDAITKVVQDRVNVEFVFNGLRYNVDTNALFGAVKSVKTGESCKHS